MNWKKLNRKIDGDFLKNNDVKLSIRFKMTPLNSSMPNPLVYQWHYNHETGKLEDLRWDDCSIKSALDLINNAEEYYDEAEINLLYKPNSNTLKGYITTVPKLNFRKML